MPYVTSEQLLKDAQRRRYAVGAFNVENLEMALAVVRAACELRAPVILQTTPSTLRYAPPSVFAATVGAIAARSAVPVALHLDHGSSVALARDALEAGYTSLMIDGSQKPFDENVSLACEVVRMAREKRVPVEAELGKVGGKEDDLVGEGNNYTDPSDAVEFVRRTGISSLAVAIGTAHGVYRGTPVLDVPRLAAIRRALDAAGLSVPLVLHGASGLSDGAVRDCIREGICKVNFATELRQAYTGAVRDFLSSDPDAFDPKKYGSAAMDAVVSLVRGRMIVCGADGKA